MAVLYTAKVSTTGGREGKSESDDKKLVVTQSRPGSSGNGTNPEQLFAAGYSACFGGALAHVAGMKKLETGAITVQAEVTLNQNDAGFFIGATLNVLLPALDKETAEDLVRTAHQVCPYSKATRNNIDVVLKVNGAPLEA